jgi:TrmH family RNA methyltransferase
VILADAGTDPWNPNAIRASKGAVFSVPLVSCDSGSAIEWLVGRGVAVVAADPAATVPFTDVDLTGSTALTVGAEDVGLSEAWRSAASELVAIPMRGRVDSLNVATSAALLLYEAVRQRS